MIAETKLRLDSAPYKLVSQLRQLAAHPTVRNVCFLHGYISGLQDAKLLPDDDASFWRTLVSQAEDTPWHVSRLLKSAINEELKS